MSIPGIFTDNELLIELVKARPALWNRITDDYSDKPLKKKCWIEVCRAMKKNYDDMNKSDQRMYYDCVIKLWKKHTDSWASTLESNRKAKQTGSAVPKLNRYHKELLFLSKLKNSRFVVDSDESEEDEEREEEITTAGCDSDADAISDNESNMDLKEDIDLSAINAEKTIQIDDTMNRHNTSLPDDVFFAKMGAFLNTHAELKKNQTVTQEDRHIKNQSYAQEERFVKNESIIQDRHFAFFKSVHPSLTSLNDDQTLEFQSGVLNLLWSIKSAGRLNNVACNQPNSSRGYYSQAEAKKKKRSTSCKATASGCPRIDTNIV